MHNDSVWCMYSNDPNLAVFYSGDKSGLVAKTDTRRAMEIDEGVSVAVCQEHDGITRVLPVGNSVWTATSSSSVNRWLDVDTELEVETPPASPRQERTLSTDTRSHLSPEPPESPGPTTNGDNGKKKIPHNAVLRISNTAPHPGRKNIGRLPNVSVTNVRKPSEAMIADDLSLVVPLRGQPAETIEGQNGLIKHVMLNDKKRILTLDTAGEVVLWDLLKCVPIKSFGRRHLDEVVPEVNTTESVANWCAVDTKTGKITVMLEENYCFDAEVYADELDLPKDIVFREDQRINLGKWVLRNLFSKLLDEEIARDQTYRSTLRSQQPPNSGLSRPGAPTSITMPESLGSTPMVSPGTMPTPRASHNGHSAVPATPNLGIGAATPGFAPLSATLPPTVEEVSRQQTNGAERSVQPTPTATDTQHDYFSSTSSYNNNAANANNAHGHNQTEASSESNKMPETPGATEQAMLATPTSPTEEKKKGLFGKKFPMTFPKKLSTRTSTEVKPPVTTEEKSDTASFKSSEKEEKIIEDNLFGVIQKIRQEYEDHLDSKPDQPLPPGITPSLPVETPVLTPPPHTTIIIQEDNPESGGLADQYRGEIGNLGEEADTLEKIAPMWLGDLLLKNQIPYKDTVKVSFVLHPYDNQLPAISSPDGNARLNANRMLRAKKIMAYVAERIEAPPSPPHPGHHSFFPHLHSHSHSHSHSPHTPVTTDSEGHESGGGDDDDHTKIGAAGTGTAETLPSSSSSSFAAAPAAATAADEKDKDNNLKPEEYLELYCQGQRVDPNTTLATLRVHVWRTGGDVVLYYKSNGRKKLRLPHPADVPSREESEEHTGVVR
ncbi:hypothetical protein HRR86_004529 [Exophiala dermatitidis]|nr:hypothetical protein HRR77_002479 [Exophiala dermatitidis]KAJ4568422.1 hypothetical protein HRR79_004645 [Exophiala dermatitidis]KAJ4579228.1 hypothetical protein HRR82_005019 [Exophiala dermatitidis]KAJ4610339.1 hypothetical protein HRR85_005604 [Exophiala dermatitidis]KAJ4626108.1 hypothetical protein HRR86_004529 [Exophiala dermatitidis]